jgi:hypothetical protein
MKSEPVASRTFDLRGVEVTCTFGKPQPEGSDYFCEYEIVFPGRNRLFRAFGIDEVQALLHAMQMAHADLLASNEYQVAGLTWLDMRDLGLPLAGGRSPGGFRHTDDNCN